MEYSSIQDPNYFTCKGDKYGVENSKIDHFFSWMADGCQRNDMRGEGYVQM
jgi:hypothetical protein